MFSKVLKGASSLQNWARNRAGPLIVFIESPVCSAVHNPIPAYPAGASRRYQAQLASPGAFASPPAFTLPFLPYGSERFFGFILEPFHTGRAAQWDVVAEGGQGG